MPPLDPPHQAYLFDMDGVLCDSEPIMAQAAVAMFRSFYGLNVRVEEFREHVGSGTRYLTAVAERHGLELRFPEASERLYEQYLRLIPDRLQPVPGSLELLRALRRAGMPVGLVTSAHRVKLWANLSAIGLSTSDFDEVVSGDDDVAPKPAPDGFLLAARRLHRPAQSCLVLEDSPNGVRAARAAGCRCLGLNTSFPAEDLFEAGAERVLPDLRGLDGPFQLGALV